MRKFEGYSYNMTKILYTFKQRGAWEGWLFYDPYDAPYYEDKFEDLGSSREPIFILEENAKWARMKR